MSERPYPDGIAWDEALAQRHRADEAEAEIERLRDACGIQHTEIQRLRGRMNAAITCLTGHECGQLEDVSDE